MRIGTGRPHSFSNFFGKRWNDFVANRCWDQVRSRFALRTSCCCWIRQPFPCVCPCFRGRSSRKSKAASKPHVLLDHDDYMPRFVHFTGAFHSDVQAAHLLPVQRGSIIVMDRAYIEYDHWAKWITQGMFFVTQHRHDLSIQIIEERSVPQNRNIRRDKLISLSSLQGQKECPFPLRRVEVWNPEQQETIVLLTNHLTFGASTIADIYRQRWQIEVFFKTLKQNLKIKTFVGTSENALLIQIWTALIAMLLLRWLHFLSQRKWSFSNLSALLRMNLFTYRDLIEWLSDPFGTPPLQPQQLQLALL